MNLLRMAQAVADRIGIARPSSISSSPDQQAANLKALLTQEGRELASRHQWQSLIRETTFTATATEEQTGALPEDFDRFVDGTFWNRTERRKLLGPFTAVQWQEFTSSTVQPVDDAFRVRGNAILLMPTPTAGDTYAFEYVSSYWVGNLGDTTGSADVFSNDADIAFVPDELLILGCVWRYLRSRGLDYSEPFRSYEMELSRRIGRDGGSETLHMDGPQERRVGRLAYPYVFDLT